MWWFIAQLITKELDVENLILLCPAVYDKKSFNVKFNDWFTEIIREPNSRKNSHSFDILKSFKWNLLIVIGKKDNVIPKWITEKIYDSSCNSKSREILRLDDADHMLHFFFKDNPNIFKWIFRTFLINNLTN